MFANERGVDTLDRLMYSLIIPFLPSLYITQDHFTGYFLLTKAWSSSFVSPLEPKLNQKVLSV